MYCLTPFLLHQLNIKDMAKKLLTGQNPTATVEEIKKVAKIKLERQMDGWFLCKDETGSTAMLNPATGKQLLDEGVAELI